MRLDKYVAERTGMTRSEIRKAIVENLQDFLYSRTERRPMILPMLIEMK